MKNIAASFIKAKKDFAPALKTSTNPHFKSRYADLAACIEAVDDSFLKNGIVMYQETFEDATGVTVETVLMHESGEIIRCGKLHVPASKQDAQGYGSALSYARRYSLMAACGIAPEDDDGNKATANPVDNIDEWQAENILSIMKETHTDNVKFFKWLGVKQVSEIPLKRYDEVISALEKKRAKEIDIPKL